LPTHALKNPTSSTSDDDQCSTLRGESDPIAENGDAPDSGAEHEIDVKEEAASDAADPPEHDPRSKRWWPRLPPPRLALVIGLVMTAALAALLGVLGVRAHHAHQSAQLRALYLQVGRQGAVNLTTIDWHHADDDVQRILASATGSFYDDFNQRSAPFVEVVKKVQSISTGTVTVAGLESSTDTDAQVLVAVNVETTTSEAPQQTLRAWRMRISVQKVGNDVKVSNVEFVP
jgi:Mce-associated membrane protein